MTTDPFTDEPPAEKHRPTDEQMAAIDLFLAGENMVIDAGAGTGKTSTLVFLAGTTRAHGRYIAFNKSIVSEAKGKFPQRCSPSTAHSLAFQAVGKHYQGRLNGARLRSNEIAAHLGIDPIVIRRHGQPKHLASGWLAGHVVRALTMFCQSTDDQPDASHFPYAAGLDDPPADAHAPRPVENNLLVARELEHAVRKAWNDVVRRDGVLPFKHEHYLKIWGLSHPRITADYILFDEAQDANPVMAQIIAEQAHAQRVYVGDENQAIYGFTGAVDAMAGFDPSNRRSLTRSFRFGPAIAERANQVLAVLDTTMRIVGFDQIASTIGPLDEGVMPDAVLTRTNAKALEVVLGAQRDNTPVHLVGGGEEIARFARAARDLMAGQRTGHPDLSCFDNWPEVVEYVGNDPQGGELALMVRLVDEFGPERMLAAVDGTTPEGPGVLTVSTAHKAKGREWPVVQIAADFVDVDPDTDELRLRYVAFTRAREHLDDSVFDAEATPPPAAEADPEDEGDVRMHDLLDGMHPQDIESGYNPPGTPAWRS